MLLPRLHPWDGGWVDQPNPELIDHIIAEIMDCHSGTLTCLFPDELALLAFDWDCLNLSIYHPSAEMQQLLAPIAASEGLFFRAAETVMPVIPVIRVLTAALLPR